MPSPLPQIEALIEEHQLLKRIYRQRTGEDETAVIGELGEAISAVDVFSDIPVLMAKAWAGGISLEGAGEALSMGAAGLFLRSLGGNPMDVHLHTSVNLRRPAGLDRASRRDRVPRQLHRDARLQAPPVDRRGVPRHPRALALDAPGLRRPSRGISNSFTPRNAG